MTPETRPPSANLPQPRVHLVSIALDNASPPAFGLDCISGPMLKSAGFEMAQMVWYRGSSVAVKEQEEKGHSTQNIGRGGTNSISVGDCS